MFRAGIIAAAAMLLIAAASIPKPSIAAEYQGPEHGVSAQGEPAHANQRPDHLPTTVPPNIKAKPNDGTPAVNPDEHHQRGIDWPTWVEAFSAFATAAFTLVLAVATIRLWNSTKGLHDETKRLAALAEIQSVDMKDSIAAAKQVAEAATSAANTSKDALSADRAWMMNIVAKSTRVKNIVLEGESLGPGFFLQFSWRNVGRSPALRAAFHSKMYPVTDGSIPDIKIPIFLDAERRRVIGPTDEVFVEQTVSLGDLEAVKRGDIQIWMYAKIVYGTIRMPNEIFYTEWCAMLDYITDAHDDKTGETWPVLGWKAKGPRNDAI